MLSARLRRPARRTQQSGQALIILLVCLVLVVGAAGLAADAGHSYSIKRNVQNAADAAALAAGKQLIGAVQNGPPTDSSSNAAVIAANGFASNNGFTTTRSTSCDQYTAPTSTSQGSFATTWVDTGLCSTPSAANTVVTIHDPPVVAPDGTPVPSACQGTAPYNCFQVVIQQKVPNYIMGIFGFRFTTVTASAVVNAHPASTGFAAPPAIALYLYEPSTSFDTTQAPSRTNLSCPAGLTAGTTRCPTFWVKQGATTQINGINGSNLTPAIDTVALESAGHMVVQGQTTICDPYNGTTSGAACQSNHTVGAKGFAVGAGANYYCQKLNGTTPGGCTIVGQSNLQPLWGNTTTYATASFTPTVDLNGMHDCSTFDLILNGESVASKTSGRDCSPPSSDPYTIQPGKYHSITINHGTYEFESGLYDITGTAPVSTNGPSSGCKGNSSYVANGIDHCMEVSADQDLCTAANQANANACPNLTAGVWIGHGSGWNGTYSAGTTSSCTGGSAGTSGGGGDDTIISGAAVSFRFEPGSAGFVSTNEVKVIGLSAPGLGALKAVNYIPLLFDMENNGYIHLDAGSSPPSGTFSQFIGLVYQTMSATGGGFEVAADLSHNNGAALQGQVLAYSYTSWGNGTAIDFTAGYGSSVPTIATSGNAENSVITTPAPGVSAAVDHNGNAIAGYETFTVNYADEWALDGYDTYVRINGASPAFFSQNEWGPPPAAGAALPPNGGSGLNQNSNPNDTTTPTNYAAWPVWPASQSTVLYPNASTSGYTAYLNSKTNRYDDWVETIGSGANTSYFETSGSWTWGHQKDIAGSSSGNYSAQIKYTFPTPAGASVAISIFLTDGDHCGDYATASYSFANIGQPNGGQQTSGSVELLE